LKLQSSHIEPACTGVVEDGSDYGAIKRGFLSATPLHMPMMDYQKLEGLEEDTFC